jgi:uncharacterized protein
MGQPDVTAAQQYALDRLERELDPRLWYHSLAHTRDDVLPAAEQLAALEGIADADLLLLRTAALFHDIGFLVTRVEHERAGVQVMRGALPHFGYAPGEIARIGAMIMATRLPQTPNTLLERILADADLDLLGRTDFRERNNELRKELQAFGDQRSNAEWYANQLAFVTSHTYWTPAARRLRDAQKAHNRELLKALAEG